MTNIRISQIGSYVEGQLEQLLRVTVLETDARLKQESPVDTGRFRVSWQIGENAANSMPAPDGKYSAITPPTGTNYQPGQERLSNYYSVHNNLPYAEPLAQGHSSRAPAGWTDRIAREMQQFVDRNWQRIKREG